MPRSRRAEPSASVSPSVATLKSIAQQAGVHPSTVSRALNPREAGKVNPDTVLRIKDIAARLGYEPNPWARSLRTQESLTIGMVLPRLTDSVLARMFEAAEGRARELGYQAITVSTNDSIDEEHRMADHLLERRVDGIIFATCRLDDPLPADLAERGVPFMLMNRASGEFPVVRADDAMGGYLATRHLIGLGHRRIALVAGQLDVSTAALRLEGYRLAHTEMGMEVDERLVVPCEFSAVGGIRAGGQLLSMPDRPTGIVAVNDSAAVGVMSVARDLGFHIPDDLSVIGYNDDQLAALLPVPLSSIHLPLERIGRGTVDLLVGQLRGETSETVVEAPTLVARSSTSHPPGH